MDNHETELAELRSEVERLNTLIADWHRAYTSLLMGLPDTQGAPRLLARMLEENVELRRYCEDLERKQG